jgi:hypothetical protein
MAYTPLVPADIVAGKPTKEEIFQTIHDNCESFNTDIEALKQTASIDIFNMTFTGYLNQYVAADLNNRIPVYRAPVDATIVSFVATLLSASTSGTLELEIDKSIDDGVNWSPLLTGPVQLTGTSVGSQSGAVTWVDVPSQSFNQGDLLRVRVTGLQASQGSFHLSIYGEV